jgi:Uma2 family endonuclease
MATTATLLTAEKFIALPDSFDGPVELVKGAVVAIPPTRPRHGEICIQIAYLLRKYLDDHLVGRVIGNDAGVITERDPDTVRGADIAFYSFQRVPKGALPAGLLDVAPELVFEVLSPSDRWSEVQVKVDEYLDAGVNAVCVVDDATRSIHVFSPDRPMQIFKEADDFALPEILSGFSEKVKRFFG